MEKKLSHFAIQFPVIDIDHAINWYTDKLGFECTFRWGSPVEYAVLKRDEAVSIHLVSEEATVLIDPRVIYVFCYNVDEVYKEFKEKGVDIAREITAHEYGMRDFEVIDPSGHKLVFGTGE